MAPLVRSLLKAGALYAVGEIFLRGEQAKHTFRRVAVSVAAAVLAILVAYIGLAALFLAAFFYLADLTSLVRPALLTGLLALLLALLGGWESTRRFGRK